MNNSYGFTYRFNLHGLIRLDCLKKETVTLSSYPPAFDVCPIQLPFIRLGG